MTRRICYKTEEVDNGKYIGMFLKEREYSTALIRVLKKTKTGIRKNGVWVTVNETLKTGDILEICLTEQSTSDNIVPKEGMLDILYEDEDILVVNKPYDMPIHPSVNNYDNTLANIVLHYGYQQDKSYVFRCINRLDRDTTGVTIIAKNMISASILSRRMRERQLKRTYIAFVEGIIDEEGTIDLPIGREEGSIIKRKIDKKEGNCAVTHYYRLEVIEVEGELVSVVALQLETGRTHQIRVHMAAIGHPLIGDFLYNEENSMLTRQGLHAVQCAFYHPITGEYKRITAPLSKDMRMLMKCSPGQTNKLGDLDTRLQMIKW